MGSGPRRLPVGPAVIPAFAITRVSRMCSRCLGVICPAAAGLSVDGAPRRGATSPRSPVPSSPKQLHARNHGIPAYGNSVVRPPRHLREVAVVRGPWGAAQSSSHNGVFAGKARRDSSCRYGTHVIPVIGPSRGGVRVRPSYVGFPRRCQPRRRSRPAPGSALSPKQCRAARGLSEESDHPAVPQVICGDCPGDGRSGDRLHAIGAVPAFRAARMCGSSERRRGVDPPHSHEKRVRPGRRGQRNTQRRHGAGTLDQRIRFKWRLRSAWLCGQYLRAPGWSMSKTWASCPEVKVPVWRRPSVGPSWNSESC